jgi:hypothetical protein
MIIPIKQLEIISDFLTDDEQTLVKRCAAQRVDGRAGKVELKVRELGRVGRSGARLLLCKIDGGLPFVLKIAERSKIVEEDEAIERVRNNFRDAEKPARPVYRRNLGALLYWHQGGSTEQQIKDSYELRDCLYNAEWSDESLIRIFEGIGHACAGAREKISSKELLLGREYRQYLRRNKKTREDRPTKVLMSLFGVNQEKHAFSFMGETILNPILFLKSECFKTKLPVTVGPIHGDLHPSNVIIDKTHHVHLIDFAWADKKGHVLKDYVLMECSLRFMLFPHYVNPGEQLKVDKLLLSRHGSKKLETWQSPSPINHHYQTLGKILTILREQASKFLSARSDEGFLEYLAAEFLMLYGLMKFNDYNRLVAARALGLIAKKLSEKKFAVS